MSAYEPGRAHSMHCILHTWCKASSVRYFCMTRMHRPVKRPSMQAALPSPTYFDLQQKSEGYRDRALVKHQQEFPAAICQFCMTLIASCRHPSRKPPAYLAAILWPRDAYKIIIVTISPVNSM